MDDDEDSVFSKSEYEMRSSKGKRTNANGYISMQASGGVVIANGTAVTESSSEQLAEEAL